MLLTDVLYLVRHSRARHFNIQLEAESKAEYQTKVRDLYQTAGELQQRMGCRVLLWMRRKNVPGTFEQRWVLAVLDPFVWEEKRARLVY